MDLCEIDRKLSEMAVGVDFYPHLTPVNRGVEKEKFFAALREGGCYNPQFVYGERNFENEKKTLLELRDALDETDILQRIFAEKIEFMLTELELLESGDGDFADIARRLHGEPTAECTENAVSILAEIKSRDYVFPDESIAPEEMASILRATIDEKGLDWTVKVTDKIIPKMTVSGKDKTLYVNSGIKYTEAEVQRLKVHEVKVHIFRGANGAAQPYKIFTEGLAGYNETEEGLAILLEEMSGCLDVDTRQMKLYAGRALSVDLCLKGSFYDAYLGLSEFFPDYMAYRLVERAKRGLKDTSRKGCLTKGYHYISGWRKLRKYIEEGGDLSIIYLGKVKLEDANIVKVLVDKGVLKPAKYLPDLINK
ncbi:MAG: tyrosine/phenylalanine carboxypeptidase domain-containing protein [Candidatus Omnitrophota bacterium]